MENDVNRDIGERLKKFRKEHNINQSEMGDILNKPQSTISKLESGVHLITAPDLYLLAKQTGLNANWLVLGEGENKISFDKNTDKEYQILNEYVDALEKNIRAKDAMIDLLRNKLTQQETV